MWFLGHSGGLLRHGHDIGRCSSRTHCQKHDGQKLLSSESWSFCDDSHGNLRKKRPGEQELIDVAFEVFLGAKRRRLSVQHLGLQGLEMSASLSLRPLTRVMTSLWETWLRGVIWCERIGRRWEVALRSLELLGGDSHHGMLSWVR